MILLHIVVCIVRVQECLGFEYMQLQYLLLCILSYVIVIFCPGKRSDSKVFYCLLGFRLSPHREHVHAPGCMDDEQKASLVCLQHPETSYGVTGRYGLIAQFVAYRFPFFTLTSLQQVLLGMYSCFCFHASEKATFYGNIAVSVEFIRFIFWIKPRQVWWSRSSWSLEVKCLPFLFDLNITALL